MTHFTLGSCRFCSETGGLGDFWFPDRPGFCLTMQASPIHPSEAPWPKATSVRRRLTKKPKKDTSAPQSHRVVSDRPTPPVTTVVPVRGKLKNK
jgi:hypothetical protein